MVFSSLPFLFVFLPLFLLFYFLLPARNLVALVFSLFFYAWGEGLYVLLLMGVTAFNYGFGLRIESRPGNRWIVFMAVAFNVTVIVWFKYAAFILIEVLALPIDPQDLPRLPLGISFFIFQSISYLVDVWRRQEKACTSLPDLALYICMFPQLIAGPIVRYSTVAAHLRSRTVSLRQVQRGCLLFVLGLSQKVLIANNVGIVADRVFSMPAAELNPMGAWLGAVAYGLQIFHDFAGYSLMAIGIGAIMGFEFPQNFNFPYISRTVTEFWRRWHMSLSSWFSDYLYIPLGGNRKGAWRTLFNLYLVFVLCGLWHGAAWTFVIWGLFHGTLLVIERLGLGQLLARIPAPVSVVYTLLVVLIGWVIFRADSLASAVEMLRTMAGLGAHGPVVFPELVSHQSLLFGLAGIVFSVPVWKWILRLRSTVGSTASPAPNVSLGLLSTSIIAALFLTCCMVVYASPFNPFIYFRF